MKLDFQFLLPAQHTLNKLATGDEDYALKGLPFYRKAWEEAGELLTHLGDYWWKPKTVDTNQAFLELIDILHFILGEYLTFFHQAAKSGQDPIVTAGDWLSTYVSPTDFKSAYEADEERFDVTVLDENGFRTKYIRGVEMLINMLIAYSQSNKVQWLDAAMKTLIMLVYGLGQTEDAMQELYVQKFTLNVFRQDNGYRAGTYMKLYDGKSEDNVFLVQLHNDLLQDSPVYRAASSAKRVTILYERLGNTYIDLVLSKISSDPREWHELDMAEQADKLSKMFGGQHEPA